MTKKLDQTDNAWAQSLAISFRFLFVTIFILGAGWLVSNCRLVAADSRAVVLRFGTVVREDGPGLLLALPRPFEDVLLLPSADRQIEYRVQAFSPRPIDPNVPPDAPYDPKSVMADPRENAALILTGDRSIVVYNATVFYRITDAKAYVLASEQVAPALERLFVSSAIAVTGSRDLDAILIARPEFASAEAVRLGRERLRADLMDEVNRRLAQLAEYGGGLGITVGRVDLVPQLPVEAKTAFDAVLVTLQNMETEAARSRTEAETTTQQYNQYRDRTLTEAQALAEERTREAQTRTAAIGALAREAGLTGNALANQIFGDRIGAILQRAQKVMTTDADGGTHLIVPGATSR